MRPMTLKEAAPCCQSPILNWDKSKLLFICPCGKMEADELGRLIDRDVAGGRKPRGRPKRGRRPLAQTNGGISLRDPDFLDLYGLDGLEGGE